MSELEMEAIDREMIAMANSRKAEEKTDVAPEAAEKTEPTIAEGAGKPASTFWDDVNKSIEVLARLTVILLAPHCEKEGEA